MKVKKMKSEEKGRRMDLQLDGRKIRIDYSVTKRAHSPTPGNYQGFLPGGSGRGGGNN